MRSRILLQIRLSELEQRSRRTQPVFLQMNERPGQLNEALEKISVRPPPIRQPQLFEHIVSLVEQLVVKTIEVTEIVRIELLSLKRRYALRDLSALLAHAPRLITPPPDGKSAHKRLDAPCRRDYSFRIARSGGITRMIHRAKTLIALLTVLITGELCFAAPEVTTPHTNSDYVVLLHGLIRTSSAMKRLEWAFEEQGYRVINITYPCTKLPIEDIAATTLADILKERIQDPTVKVHFVTHSLGGIVLREYLSNNQMTNLGRVVMIAPPNHGSELVDKFRKWPFFEFFTGPAGQQLGTNPESVPKRLGPARFDLGVIAGDRTLNPFYSWFIPGPDDGKVSVASTKLEGMDDFLIVHYSHTYLPWRKQVVKACVQFIEEGQFAPIPAYTPVRAETAPKESSESLKTYTSPKTQAMR